MSDGDNALQCIVWCKGRRACCITFLKYGMARQMNPEIFFSELLDKVAAVNRYFVQ
jgi:hypothetical protein